MQELLSDYIEVLPIDQTMKRRVAIALSCTDSELIPKVPHAGQVFSTANERYQVMHNGVKVIEDCYYGRWMTELIKLLHGHHEPQEEKVFHEVLRYVPDNSVMVELGSFWGYYSLWFNGRISGAKNHLIEPDLNNLEVGKKNFALNTAQGAFHLFSVGRASGGPQPFGCESDGVSRLVPSISVDDFIAQNNLPSIEVLFADIQGAELKMLEGAVNSIAEKKIRFVFLSTHHHTISGDPLTHQKCLSFLQHKQAHIIAAHNVTESYSGDGLIVASFHDTDRDLPEIALSKNHPTNSLFRELEYDLYDAQQDISSLRQQLLQAQTKAPQPLLMQRLRKKLTLRRGAA